MADVRMGNGTARGGGSVEDFEVRDSDGDGYGEGRSCGEADGAASEE